jgi:uncharacterized protein (DUF952 family)
MSELFVFKILTEAQWRDWKAGGTFAGSSDDLRDGFIHLSTRDQVAGTLARHFAQVERLVLAMVDVSALPEPPRWEPSRGGALFPHAYAPLPIAAVMTSTVLRLGGDGRHALPAGF